ncbi:MAG: carboxypeptidase-like regulatory domain-containing protein, partial [Gemmatimonadaceae bacterium]
MRATALFNVRRLTALMLAVPLAAALAQSGTATVSGTVYDSIARHPLGDAVVQLIAATPGGPSYTTTADAAGRYAVAGVQAGHYSIGFYHPTVDSLGIDGPVRAVDVAGGDTRVSLALPSARRMIAAICGVRATATDSTALVVGHLRDASTGEPIAAGSV